MKQMIRTVIGVVLTLSGLSAMAAPASKPNIVYVLADDMGYADAGFMGCKDIHTPSLDALAKESMVMDSFYVQPVCSPSRVSLLTGRYVCHTGIYSVVTPPSKGGLPVAERTLPQTLKDAGYETALVGKWHLGRATEALLPTHRGFDHQYGNWLGQLDYFTHLRDHELDWHKDDKLCDDQGYTTFLDVREACRLINEKTEDRPLLLYLAFNAIHLPLEAPQEYFDRYKDLKGQRQRYAAVTTAMDDGIPQVIDASKRKGIYDNTLIIFSSDNSGFAPGVIADNGPLRAGKGTIYEGGVRVPAFVHWPGHVPVGRTSEPLHVVDWYPTLVKLAGGRWMAKISRFRSMVWTSGRR